MPAHHTSPSLEASYVLLAESVRRLVDVAIRSEVGIEDVRAAAAKIDSATAQLSAALIPGARGVERAADGTTVVWGNAAIGLRNAIAPPLVVRHQTDGRVRADATLGAAYEGPAGHVHGGICALILDHVLGATAHQPGRPAVTGTLTLRYEAGTRLGPVRAVAWVERVEGAKTFAVGHLETSDGVTVRAEGVFFHPLPAQT